MTRESISMTGRGARGESLADIARRIGSIAGVDVSTSATDADVLNALNDGLIAVVESAGYTVIEAVATATAPGDGNITLSGEQTIAGVLTSTDRVLVTDQTDASENGIYVTAAGAWARATDFDQTAEVVQGSLVPVTGGDNAGSFVLVTADPITVGTTDQDWRLRDWRSSAKINFTHFGTGAITRSLQLRGRDLVVVTDYLDPDWGNGTNDDAPGIIAAIAAHPGKRIYFPRPSVAYNLGGPIGELPTGTILMGDSKRNTKLLRGYSAADYLLELGESTGLENMWIDGNGAIHTGGLVEVMLATGRQQVRDVRIINAAGGIPIHFPCTGATSAEASGSQSDWHNVEAYRVDSSAGLGRYAVVHDDAGVGSAGHPISFTHLETSGYESIDFGSCNNFFVHSSSLFHIATSDNGVGVDITGGRISEGTGGPVAITLAGSGDMTGVHCYPEIIFNATPGNAWTFNGGWMNSGYTDNNPNSTTVVYDRTLTTFTPVFYAGGVAITVGNGSVHGRWERQGTLVKFDVRLIIGSTTSIGAGSLTVDIPTKCDANIPAQVSVFGHITDSSPAAFYKFGGRIVSGELVARLERDTSGAITATSPITLAAGDTIHVSGWYRR